MRSTFAAASALALALVLVACSDDEGTSARTTSDKPVILTAEPTPAPCNTIVVDPGHDERPNPATEPIGPGSSQRKIKDGGGTSGIVTHTPESVVNLQIALRLRRLLTADGYCVRMTRDHQTGVSMGNIQRAQIANRAKAALFIRIHADGSTNRRRRGTSVLYPAAHTGWTDDILPASRIAAAKIQRALVPALRSKDLGIVARPDLTGFNWADVPAVLPELGFLTNPREDRLLTSPAYQQRAAKGMERGIRAFVPPRKQ
jgi:N-acetylmuramoyl-L-alanine amidase